MTALLTHDEAALRDAAQWAVEQAAKRGARARASVRHEGIAKTAVRDGEIEMAERSGSQSLGLTVFHNGRRGSASTAGFDRAAIDRVVEEAMLIAAHVQPDPDADLPPADRLAFAGPAPLLYGDSPRSAQAMLEAARALDRITAEIAGSDSRLRAGESVALATEGLWALATSDGFCRTALRSNDARWTVMLAQDDGGSISDFCQSQERRIEALIAPETLARDAAARAPGTGCAGRGQPPLRGVVRPAHGRNPDRHRGWRAERGIAISAHELPARPGGALRGRCASGPARRSVRTFGAGKRRLR